MSNYWVMAQLSEPKYNTEWKFLTAELDFVRRKIAERRPGILDRLPLKAFGVYSAKEWRHYERELKSYAAKLDKYAKGVEEGVLPVKFTVFNDSSEGDNDIRVHLKVTHGRIDELRKAPARPDRLDGRGKPWKFSVPAVFGGFSRRKIKITAHGVGAEFSQLGARDGAVLVNQVVHLHCTDDTTITYELSSKNVQHEVGEVELAQ